MATPWLDDPTKLNAALNGSKRIQRAHSGSRSYFPIISVWSAKGSATTIAQLASYVLIIIIYRMGVLDVGSESHE
jgi:hypothetical protein